jgi:hypothetical protein
MRDYSLFKHEDHRKESNGKAIACSKCHTIPSAAEPDRVAAANRPRGAQSFPYHDSCWGCHREQVFRGDRPAICTVCHTKVSPRMTSRDVYPNFPGPKHSNTEARELPAHFPHGLHLSATVRNWPGRPDDLSAGFVRVSFSTTTLGTTLPPRLACSACHSADGREPAALLPKVARIEEAFRTIKPDTFMTIPGGEGSSAHDSCFNCHWEAQEPTKDDCGGCHLARANYAETKLKAYRPAFLMPDASNLFKGWPAGLPKRVSLRFRHHTHSLSEDGKSETNEHGEKCTACHLNVTRVMPVRNPKAEVQIIACARCHATKRSIPGGEGVKLSISDELRRKDDPAKNYTCVACHAEAVGRERAPCSHYFAIGEPCPK